MLLPLRSSKQCAPKSFDKIVLSNLLKVSNDIKLMKNIKIIQFQNSHTNIFLLQYFFGFRPFHYVKIWTTKTSRVQIRGETSGGLTTYYTIDLRRIPKPLENPTTYLLMSSVQNRNVSYMNT